MYITLADHINFAIERQKDGVAIKNALLWEIKKFYNHEFLVGKEALSIIKTSLVLLYQKMKQDSLHYI